MVVFTQELCLTARERGVGVGCAKDKNGRRECAAPTRDDCAGHMGNESDGAQCCAHARQECTVREHGSGIEVPARGRLNKEIAALVREANEIDSGARARQER